MNKILRIICTILVILLILKYPSIGTGATGYIMFVALGMWWIWDKVN